MEAALLYTGTLHDDKDIGKHLQTADEECAVVAGTSLTASHFAITATFLSRMLLKQLFAVSAMSRPCFHISMISSRRLGPFVISRLAQTRNFAIFQTVSMRAGAAELAGHNSI